jgi:hypothetical protein
MKDAIATRFSTLIRQPEPGGATGNPADGFGSKEI